MIEIQLSRQAAGGPAITIQLIRDRVSTRVVASQDDHQILASELLDPEWTQVESALADLSVNLMPRAPFPLLTSEYELSIVSDVLSLRVQWGPTLGAGWESLPKVFAVLQGLVGSVQRRLSGLATPQPQVVGNPG